MEQNPQDDPSIPRTNPRRASTMACFDESPLRASPSEPRLAKSSAGRRRGRDSLGRGTPRGIMTSADRLMQNLSRLVRVAARGGFQRKPGTQGEGRRTAGGGEGMTGTVAELPLSKKTACREGGWGLLVEALEGIKKKYPELSR